jgi:hypothetical protein
MIAQTAALMLTTEALVAEIMKRRQLDGRLHERHALRSSHQLSTLSKVGALLARVGTLFL